MLVRNVNFIPIIRFGEIFLPCIRLPPVAQLTVGFKAFCNQILEIDKSTRFAGIANKDGLLLVHAYRRGLEPLLTAKESEISVLQSVIRSSTRTTLEKKLGKTLYSLTAYQKVKRATLPMKSDSGQLQILMVSFEVSANVEQIVVEEILPLMDGLII